MPSISNFLNGGGSAVIVRVVHSDAKKAVFENSAEPGITFEAANEGEWANTFRITTDDDVNDDATDKDKLFNVRVKKKIAETNDANKDYQVIENFLNLSFESGHGRYVDRVLEEESDLVHVGSNTLAVRPAGELNFDVAANRGVDGSDIESLDLTGDPGDKTGINALDKTDIFNLLCLPSPDKEGEDIAGLYDTALTEAELYCKKKRAMLIVDPPSGWTDKDDPIDGSIGIDHLGLSRSENAVIYFPRIRAPDPLEESRLRTFPPCGVVAGIMAKTDAQRGSLEGSSRLGCNSDRRARSKYKAYQRRKRRAQSSGYQLLANTTISRPSGMGCPYNEGCRQPCKPVEVSTCKEDCTLHRGEPLSWHAMGSL